MSAARRVCFGTRVIEQMMAQLKGSAHLDWHPEGLACDIVLRA
jgi:two-component sensor histidine kinase